MRGSIWERLLLLLGCAVVSCQRSTAARSPLERANRSESVERAKHAAAKGANPADGGPFEMKVEVGGGLRLHIHCEGRGTPRVVFDSGLGDDAHAWDRVEGPIARFTRACSYDRAGRGQSDPAKRPHSNRQMARELAALLENSGERGASVLVGHSMGGTNVQLLLAEYPDRVAGMVLIDASPEPPPIERIPPAALADFERQIAAFEGLDLQTLLAGFEELRGSKRTLGEKPLRLGGSGMLDLESCSGRGVFGAGPKHQTNKSIGSSLSQPMSPDPSRPIYQPGRETHVSSGLRA